MFSKLFRVSLLLLASLASYQASADIQQTLKHEVRSEENKAPSAVWYSEILATLLAEKDKLNSAQ